MILSFSRALFKRTSSILSSTMRSREKYARTPLLFFDVHLVRNLWNSHHRIFSAEQSFGFGSLTCVSKLRRFHHLRRTWECIGMCQDNSGNGKWLTNYFYKGLHLTQFILKCYTWGMVINTQTSVSKGLPTDTIAIHSSPDQSLWYSHLHVFSFRGKKF